MAERQAKAATKVQAEKEKAANFRKVAELERVAKRKTREMDRQANNPVNKPSQPRTKQTRPVPDSETVHEGIHDSS